jgi:hypothetical protein
VILLLGKLAEDTFFAASNFLSIEGDCSYMSPKEPKRAQKRLCNLNTTGMSLDRVLSQIVPVSLISSFEILRGRLDS